MLHWTPFPFVRYVVVLSAGILFQVHVRPAPTYLPGIFAGLAVAYGLLAWRLPRAYRGRWSAGTGLVGLAALFVAGVLITRQRTDDLDPGHLLHEKEPVRYYRAVIASAVQERAKSYRAEATLEAIEQAGRWKPSRSRLLLLLDKNGEKPRYGDVLLVRGQPVRVAAPANPGEFDYRQYLQHQHVYHRHFLRPTDYLITDHQVPHLITAYATRVGQYAQSALTGAIGSKREYAIANALVLGVRDDLDDQLMRAYAASGAVHVLSVSGMHVGIFFLLFSGVLGWVRRLRHGPVLFAGLMLGLLWFYAFVTALSPTVLRATAMFSFVVVGGAVQRRSNVYNTLAMSAFGLLCYDPYYLLSVGFQLSYLAVAGIVLLVPGFYRLLEVPDPHAAYRQGRFWRKLKNRSDYGRFIRSLGHLGLDWLWSATCVAVAAQLVTFPLVLYYFHQFPAYFLLANPAVLLLSTAVLPLGLAIILLAFIPPLAAGLGFLLKWAIWLLNASVFLTERLPHAVVGGISITPLETGLLYALLLAMVGLFALRRFGFLWVGLGLVLALAGSHGSKLLVQPRRRALVVHSIRQHPVVSLIEGNRGTLLADSAFLVDERGFDFYLANYWWRRGVSETERVRWGNPGKHLALSDYPGFSLLVWNGKSVLFVRRPLNRRQIRLPARVLDYLVVQNGAVRNLAELTAGLRPKQLVLDASNPSYLNARLSKEAARLGIPCHDAHARGAWVVEWEVE
ncbi:MAG: ComEC family competence protein [Ferruginibacter sp.]|nr:ComEC family competence protein [Cytophagales bacterium]